MTEMSPLGSAREAGIWISRASSASISAEAGLQPVRRRMKVTDDDNVEHPRRQDVRPAEGQGAGGRQRLLWRRGEQFDADGWFDTGDVAHIVPTATCRSPGT